MRPDKELEPASGVDGLEAPYAVTRADQAHLVQSCGRVTANDLKDQEGESKRRLGRPAIIIRIPFEESLLGCPVLCEAADA